ncbi:cytochrome P450 [Mycena sanguinolenta]|nr:cytochrome P450 [Mycena sanguinolenta]
MTFPPGISFSLKLLPSILAPALGTYILKWLGETYLNMHVSRWVSASLCLFSFPLIFTTRVQYKRFADQRAAAARGAALPPTVPSSIGGLDIVRNGIRNRGTEHPAEPLTQLTKSLGNIYCLRILFENRFFTCEPEHMKILLATGFNSFEKGEDTRVVFEPLLGSGIFSSDGELWKFHRAMTRPFFKRDRLSDFELFDRHSNEAVSAIKDRLREGHPIDFQDVVSRFAMDSSSEFLFGRNPHTLAAGLPYPSYVAKAANPDASNAFAEALNQAQLITTHRGAFGAAWPVAEFWHDRLAEPIRVIREFLDPILSEAVARRGGHSGEKQVATEKHAEDREVQEGESLVDHLLHYTQDHTMLRDEVLNLSTAGRDTTASLLTFVIYMLTDHPQVLAKLRAEILDTVGPLRAPTPDDFRDMKYLRAKHYVFILQPINLRSTTAPVIFPSMTGETPFYLPAKSKVIYSVMVMQRRKDLWGPDALQWDPERFIDERLHKYLTPNPFIFLPFNAGPRICIGQQFAYHEASFFLVRLLQNFSSISLVPTAQPIPYTPSDIADDALGLKRSERLAVKTHLTMFIEGGVWVSMMPAENAVV